MITRIGQDEAGELIISEFKKYGVDTSRIIVQEGYSTPILFILVDAKGSPRWIDAKVLKDCVLPEPVKHMVKLAEAKNQFKNTIIRKHVEGEFDFVTEGRILLLDCFQPECLDAAIAARKNNVETCLDMYFHPNLKELLRNITYCIPSRRAAADFTGETDPEAMCRKLLRLGPEVPDLKRLYEAILRNGFTHHASMIHGDYTRPIQDACEILGIEIVRV